MADQTYNIIYKLLPLLHHNVLDVNFRFVLASRLQVPMLPFFGACGRSTFIQGPTKPLSSFLEEPAIVRIDLGNTIQAYLNYLRSMGMK